MVWTKVLHSILVGALFQCIIVFFRVKLSFGNHICRHFVDVYGFVKFFVAKEFKSLVALINFASCKVFIAFKNNFTCLPCLFLV